MKKFFNRNIQRFFYKKKKKKNGEIYKTDLKIVQNLKLINDIYNQYKININKKRRK